MHDWYDFCLQVADKFFEHEFRRLGKALDDLVRQNDNIRATRSEEKVYGFIFNGINYRMQEPPTFYHTLPPFEEALVPEIDSYLKDEKKVSMDHKKIRQICALLLMPVDTEQEARDALPDELAECHPDTMPLSRQNPIDFSISEPRTARQLEELQDLIGFYAATRMIY